LNLSDLPNKNKTCLVFSYSLTELAELPKNWNQFEALMIIEPSTTEDSRRLMSWRKLFIDNGYSIWGPCVHSLECPLLTQSKHDWCHDRANVDLPEWFNELESHLPMKNKTVTTSYLLVRKTKPDFDFAGKARLVGDSLEEKGKTRQLVCRGDQREFLTWMHKKITPQTLSRGDLIDLPKNIETKSNELRLGEPVQIND
jgi:ribosomal protein RSM22 (predicted rRNA methylase)